MYLLLSGTILKRIFSIFKDRVNFGPSYGQAMVEYAITAGILISTVAILSVFLYTFREYAGRILDMVASEYP